mgnify:CR=1 FL=1
MYLSRRAAPSPACTLYPVPCTYAGAEPQAHLGAVEQSVCAGKPAGCAVKIAARRRRRALREASEASGDGLTDGWLDGMARQLSEASSGDAGSGDGGSGDGAGGGVAITFEISIPTNAADSLGTNGSEVSCTCTLYPVQ